MIFSANNNLIDSLCEKCSGVHTNLGDTLPLDRLLVHMIECILICQDCRDTYRVMAVILEVK